MAEASTTAEAELRGSRPWTQTWIDALPIAPVWAGFAIAAAHVLLGGLYFEAFVAPWPAYQGSLPTTVVFALVTGYAAAALAYARRGHEATLGDLAPALDCSPRERSALRQDALRFDAAELRRTGLIAVGIGLAVTYFTTGVARHPGLPWILWQNALTFWLLSRTIAHDVRVSGVFSRAIERHAEIELFDLTPFAPLAGRGLQSALLIVLALSLFSLILGAGDDISPLLPAMQAGTVGLAAVALVRPSLGLRRRIQAAKREEQTRLAAEIRTVRTRCTDTAAPERREMESRLATLLALKQYAGAAREWPFDLGTLGRFLLYAAIGMGSWLGSAAVERLLDRLLGSA